MATKLYPPQLESNLPAFYKTYNIDNELLGITLRIPFGMSRAVNISSIKAMYCRIRTVSTNTLILKTDLRTIVFDKEVNSIATFTIPADLAKLLNEGQYYKVQLAFSDSATPEDETIGYFSTVGIIKCVGQPKVSIAGAADFSEDSTNMFTSDFIGVYKQDTEHGDSTEKVYSYRFVLTNSKDEVIADSGVLLHDTTQDISSWESNDTFTVYSGLEEGEIGYIQYFVTTLNGLELNSYRYQVMRANSIMMENPIRITTENVYEEGYINVRLRGTIDPATNSELNYSGVFVITRSDDQGNYINWREIMRCTITGDTPSKYSFKDFTIQQGIHYRYGIQQYNSYKIFSQKILSKNLIEGANPDLEESYIDEPVYADFEDMFLYDGKRQLKIKFNPKVSSFKNTIPEQKIETIGSKYPFIFRNGHVCYKEFPIAGLVSYQMDEAMLFLSQGEELKQSDTLETDVKRIKTFPAPQVLLSGIEAQSGEGYEEIKLLRQQIVNTSSSLDGLKIKYQNYTILKNSYIPIEIDENEEEVDDGEESEIIEDKNLIQINSLAQEIIDIYELDFEIINDMIILSDDSYLDKRNMLESQIKQLKQTLEIAKNNKNALTTNLFHSLNAGYLQVSPDDPYVGSKQYYLKVVDDNGYKFVNYRPNSDWASAVAAGDVYIYDPDRYLSIIQDQQEDERIKTGPMIRHDKNLTSRNMFSERYFKLKVLDWLTDGKVKLFKSPAEGNYLVRLLNVSMTPEDHLGRMIHSFTSTGYEIAELNYENLIYYGILNTVLPTLIMNQWATKDINKILYRNQKITEGDDTGFYKIIDVKDETWSRFSCEGFAPGDIIRIYFGIESIDITIGATGSYTFDGDNRQITSVLIKPNPQTNIDDFMRQIFYESEGLSKTRFDTIADIKTVTQVAEQFVGPKKDLMEPYNLIPQQIVTPGVVPQSILNNVYSSLVNKTNINYYLNDNYKFNILDVERLKVRKRIVIPIYACENLSYDTETGKVEILDPVIEKKEEGEENTSTFNEGSLFFVTPFGKGYIYGDIIYNYDMDNGFYAIDSRMIMKDGKDVFLKIDPLDNVQLVSAVQVEDLIKVLPEFDYDGYAILQVYLPKITIDNGEVIAKEWVVSNQKGRKYFDTFTHSWWDEGVEYDPTFSINNYPNTTYTWEEVSIDPITNKEIIETQSKTLQVPLFSHLNYSSDIENRLSLIPYEEYTTVASNKADGNNIIQIDNSNIIRLDPIDEMNFSKLDIPEKISLGNGVMAELTFRLQIIDYDIELAHEYDTAGKRDNYLAAKKELQDKITYYMDNATTMMEKVKLYDETVIALEESIQLIEEYQEAKDQINTLRTAFYDRLNNYLNNYFEKQNNLLVEIEEYLDSDKGTYPSDINQNKKLWDLKIENTGKTYKTTYDEVPAREIIKDPETQQFNRETLILVDNQQKSGVGADTGIETLAKNDPNYLKKINLLINLFLSANDIIQLLRSQIGIIPSTITTYGQYRQWLKDHIDEKALYAFKYFHAWDSLEEDLSDINIAAGANRYDNVFLIPNENILNEDTLNERHSMFLLPTGDIHSSEYQWNKDPAYLQTLIPPGYRDHEDNTDDATVEYYKNIANGIIFPEDEDKIQEATEAFQSYFIALQKFFGFSENDSINNKIWENYNGYLLNEEDQSDFYSIWDEQYNQGHKTIKFIMAYPKNDVYNSLIDLAAEKDKYITAYNDWSAFHNTNKNKIDIITTNKKLLAQKEAEQKKLQDQKTAAEILLNEPNSDLTPKKRSQLEELVDELTDTLNYLSEEIINLRAKLAEESSFISDWETIDATYNEYKNNLATSANFFASQLRGYYESVGRYVNLFINTDIFDLGILELINKYVDTLSYADNDNFNMQNTYKAIEIYEENAKNIMDKLHNILLSDTGLTETDQLNDKYKTAFSLWEDLKDYYKYYENDAKTGKLDIEYNKKETYEKLLETLQPWKDMALEGFDSSQETEKIIYALAVYLASLGIEYKTEIEERYGI